MAHGAPSAQPDPDDGNRARRCPWTCGATALTGILLGAIAVIAGAACSALEDPASGFIVQIEDPAGRMGPAPWQVAVFNPYFGRERRFAMAHGGSVAPDGAFSLLSRRKEERWQFSDPLAEDAVQFGIALPSLRAEGYWLARVVTGADDAGTGTAAFCRWGEIVPTGEGETLSVTLRDRAAEPGLQYVTVVRIPPAPTDRP